MKIEAKLNNVQIREPSSSSREFHNDVTASDSYDDTAEACVVAYEEDATADGADNDYDAVEAYAVTDEEYFNADDAAADADWVFKRVLRL